MNPPNLLVLILAITMGLFACNKAAPQPSMVGVSITGIDHLADHLSIQEFSVNGYHAFRAGQGSGIVCCTMLPSQWHPGLQADIRWAVTNWRDKTYYDRQEMVAVDQYDKPNGFYVHFLPDGSVRVVSSIYYPESKDYPGPRDAIPNKNPWHQYPHGENDPDFKQIPAPAKGAPP